LQVYPDSSYTWQPSILAGVAHGGLVFGELARIGREVILAGMIHRVGRKGQVVIPKAFRKAIRLEPGDEVIFSQEGNAIRVERVVSPDALMGRLAGHRLVQVLEGDRKAESRR